MDIPDRERVDPAAAEHQKDVRRDGRACAMAYELPLPHTRYAGLINKHIKPALGRKKIKGLNRTEVCRFYNESTGGLSQSSIDYLHVTLQMILKQAVRDDLIPARSHKVR
jgi:hypothetical protein